MKYRNSSILALLVLVITPGAVLAQAQGRHLGTSDLAVFEREVALAKQLGATHVTVSEDLQPALWLYDVPDDPYPAWYIYRASILRTFPPPQLQPFVNADYEQRIAKLIEDRCAILRKYGMRGHWNSNEPQVLPEAFFTAHPDLRGPRVDQPNRSRAARFAMCVDEPEALEMYRQAMRSLIQHCPEIDSFTFLTQDSGSGFCWVPALYPGINGPAHCRNRPMELRVSGFLKTLQGAAKEAGNDVTINLNPITPRQWMIPSFSPEVLTAIVHQLPRGIAVQGREGPDGRPFAGIGGIAGGSSVNASAFYPVVGIVAPNILGQTPRTGTAAALADDEGSASATQPARRIMVNLGDPTTFDFAFRYFQATRAESSAPRNMVDRLAQVRAFAVAEVGQQQADDLLQVWSDLNEVSRGLNALDFGGMLRFGHVLNRWITRPMVPFPAELTDADKRDYRRFLFQSKDEDQANDLIDIQAMRMYEGWGAKMLFQRVVEINTPLVRSSINRVNRFRDAAQDDKGRAQWDLMSKRLDALLCLINSADNMVAYQAHLDRIRQLGLKPEVNPPLGAQSDWARTDMMELARKEIDNMIHLRQILLSTSDPILDTAPTSGEETIMRLGPNVPDQIKHKIDVMNAHWRDYDRIFTVPNP